MDILFDDINLVEFNFLVLPNYLVGNYLVLHVGNLV